MSGLARAAIVVGGLIGLLLLARVEPAAAVTYNCSGTGSPLGPYTFETWEAGDYRTRYANAMDLAGLNQLFPADPSFALPALETGDRSAGSGTTVAPYIPPVLLKAIAYIESGWAQAAYDPLVNYGETGPTLVSPDCGYGIMQVTSGMQNVSGIPGLDQAMIGGHYAYNIARGAQILAGKWNNAPEYRPLVGNRDPHVIENWYYALWAYNGFAYKNHPLNESYDPYRPPYDCGAMSRYRPYQELVLGCVANPPWRNGVRLWEPQPVSLPNLSDPAFSGPLNVNNWNPCAYSFNCAAMDMPTPGNSHFITTTPAVNRDTLLGAQALAASPPSVSLTTDTGFAQTSMTVLNSGTGLGAWRSLSDSGWLKVSRVEGISKGADIGSYSTQLILDIDLSGSPDGNYTANVIVDAPGGVVIAFTVSVHVQRETGPGCDGSLTTADVLALLSNASGLGGCVSDVPDMNCDGVINAADADELLSSLAGLPPAPC